MPNKRRNVKTKAHSPEQQFQVVLIQVLSWTLKPDVLVTHFPAGGGGRVRGAQLKRMGLLPGMPDLLFLHKGCVYFLELKAAKGRLTPAQKDIHTWLENHGFVVNVARSVEEALSILKRWGLVKASASV